MTRNVDWTQEERERLQQLQDTDADARTLHNGRRSTHKYVTLETCRFWREQIRERGVIPERVDGRGFAEATIRKHATGECMHSHSGVPVVYRDGEWVPKR